MFHYAVRKSKPEKRKRLETILARYPQSGRLQGLNMQNMEGQTVLDLIPDDATRELIMEWLSKSEKSTPEQSRQVA